jgi:hypothetical protein
LPTHYTRLFNFRDSLTDAQVAAELIFLLDEALPAMLEIDGIRDVHFWSGTGGLRADLTVTIVMDDSGAYERMLADASMRNILPRIYGAWDPKAGRETFRREITRQFIQAHSGTS